MGPPSLNPSQDARKLQMLQAELAQKDMDIMGLSSLAVIMITVFGDPENIPPGNLEYLEHVKKNMSDSPVLKSLDLWPGKQLLTTQWNLDDRISVLNK